MATLLKVALAQFLHDTEPRGIISQAKAQGAEMVVFPEMYSNGHSSFDPNDPVARERWRKAAKTIDGEYVESFRQAARDQEMYVVTTLLEAAVPKPFNSALLIDPSGETILHHRKVHICDFDAPELECARGDHFDVAEIQTSAGPVRVGLMICMDREYPEAARSLSRAGAEIALVPNCCTLARDANQSDVRIAQMRGRAFEMVMGIAVANYPAPCADGHSFAVDPNGLILAMADESPGVTIASFDLSLIRKIRTEDHFRWQVGSSSKHGGWRK